MVSFQCDACAEVVKKPKLDKHRSMCNSSFTCIDCSTTFATPADYKGHTQCISEAEKYQKALYKGPKAQPTQNSGPRGGGGYQAASTYQYGGRSSYGAARYIRQEGTGANVTPMGTPARMSPYSYSPVDTPAESPAPQLKPTTNGTPQTNSKDVAKPAEVKNNKNDKKRKADASEKPSSGEAAKTTTQTPEEPSKKKSKTKESAPVESTSIPSPEKATASTDATQEKKKKKKKQKELKADGIVEGGEATQSQSKSNDVEGASEAVPKEDGQVAGDVKKSKKRRREGEEGDDVKDVKATEDKPKKKKKSKTDKVEGGESIAVDPSPMTIPAESTSSEVKEKREKKEKKDKKDKKKSKATVAEV